MVLLLGGFGLVLTSVWCICYLLLAVLFCGGVGVLIVGLFACCVWCGDFGVASAGGACCYLFVAVDWWVARFVALVDFVV